MGEAGDARHRGDARPVLARSRALRARRRLRGLGARRRRARRARLRSGRRARPAKSSTLSGGERGRLALAGQLAAPADLLILDEPTNHLDLATTRWLEGYLHELDEAVLLISHDRAFLDAVVDHVLHFERQTAVRVRRELPAIHRAARRAARWRRARAAKKAGGQVAAEEDYIRRNIAGQNSIQAKGRRRRLARMPRLSPPPGEEGAMAVAFAAGERGGDQVLVTEQLEVRIGERQLLKPWSGILRRGDVVGLIGAEWHRQVDAAQDADRRAPADGGEVCASCRRFSVVVLPPGPGRCRPVGIALRPDRRARARCGIAARSRDISAASTFPATKCSAAPDRSPAASARGWRSR